MTKGMHEEGLDYLSCWADIAGVFPLGSNVLLFEGIRASPSSLTSALGVCTEQGEVRLMLDILGSPGKERPLRPAENFLGEWVIGGHFQEGRCKGG